VIGYSITGDKHNFPYSYSAGDEGRTGRGGEQKREITKDGRHSQEEQE